MLKFATIPYVVLGTVASIITIAVFLVGFTDWVGFGDQADRPEQATSLSPAGPALPTTTPSPTITPYPTATPYPTQMFSLDRMMLAAETGTTSEGQDGAMREIAEIAINRGNYPKAIEAGTRSARYSQEAKTLTFVARRAVENGEYAYALEAAMSITLDSDLDNARYEVFCAIGEAFSSVLTWKDVQTRLISGRFPTVEKMLESGSSSGTYSGQARSLRKVAEIAIILGQHAQAIEAGKSTVLDDPAGETLTYVARCFVEGGRLEQALDAANAIPTYSSRDVMKVEVLAAINAFSREPYSAFSDPISPSCR